MTGAGLGVPFCSISPLGDVRGTAASMPEFGYILLVFQTPAQARKCASQAIHWDYRYAVAMVPPQHLPRFTVDGTTLSYYLAATSQPPRSITPANVPTRSRRNLGIKLIPNSQA